jgi:hypothetical protein
MLYKRLNRESLRISGAQPCILQGLFLLMPVLSKSLLTLVRRHFVFLSFLSARHMNVLICSPLSYGMVIVYFKSFRYESTVA